MMFITKHGQSFRLETDCESMREIASLVFNVGSASRRNDEESPIISFCWERKYHGESFSSVLQRLVGGALRKEGNNLYSIRDGWVIVSRYRFGWLVSCVRSDRDQIRFDHIFLLDLGMKQKAGLFLKGRRDELLHKIANDIHRVVLYYPIFSILQARCGFQILHAGAVSLNGKGAIFIGAPGCGKSSIAMQLLQRHDARLLSDNLVFVKNGMVYDCYEFVRLEDVYPIHMDRKKQINPYWKDWSSSRSNCTVSESIRLSNERISLVIFVGFTQEPVFRELDPTCTFKLTEMSSWMAPELVEYQAFRCMSELVSGLLVPAMTEEIFISSIGGAGIYELGVPRDKQGIEACIESVRRTLQGGAGRR